MTSLAITRRPVVLAASASAAMMADILARIARIRGRTSAWGVSDDSTLAEYVGGYSIEANFASDYYRDGFVEGAAPAILPEWTFARAGAGTALNLAGVIEHFATGAPRITNKGLLVERARTNLLLRSQEFDNASWAKEGGIAITSNAAVAPDGTTTADLATSTGAAQITQPVTGFVGTTAAYSIFIKAGNAAMDSSFILRNSTTAINLVSATVDWTDMSVSGAGAEIEEVQDGWYRLTLTTTTGITSGDDLLIYAGTAASTGLTYYVWGAQLEAGRAPTSYIPTGAATATRAADEPQMTGANEGTYIVEGVAPSQANFAGFPTVIALSDETGTASYFVVFIDPSGVVSVLRHPTGAGSVVMAAAVALTGGQAFKIAFSFGEAGTDRLCLNGGAVATAASIGTPYFNSEARPGWWVGTPGGLNSFIRPVTYLPNRADADLLQEMTA